MSHINEHCAPPKAKRRDYGRLWVCTCDRIWVCRTMGTSEGHFAEYQPLDLDGKAITKALAKYQKTNPS